MADPLGTDIAGILEMSRAFTLIEGPEAVAHAVARIFLIERGTLKWAPSVGVPIRGGIRGLASLRLRPAQLPAIAAILRTAAVRDEERLASIEVTVSTEGNTVTIAVAGTTAEGPFEFVLRADQLTVELLSLEAA